MNINELLPKHNRLPRRQIFEMVSPFELRPGLHHHCEPRGKFNIVKINKSKLPLDFFPKQQSLRRRESNDRVNFPSEYSQQLRPQKKLDTQRKHYSPQKASFFASQQDIQSDFSLRFAGGSRFLGRKFETRQQTKREIFPLEPTRKLNTAKSYKNEGLALYPPTQDPQIYDLTSHSSKTYQMRTVLQRDISTKLRQMQYRQNPQTQSAQTTRVMRQVISQPVSKLEAIDVQTENRTIQPLTITFYNAKSRCFPPINRAKPL